MTISILVDSGEFWDTFFKSPDVEDCQEQCMAIVPRNKVYFQMTIVWQSPETALH